MNGQFSPKNVLGQLAIVLHAHLPYVRKNEKNSLEEDWLFQAIVECYIPLHQTIESSKNENTDNTKLTISLSPTLLSLLNNKQIQETFPSWIKTRNEFLNELAPKEKTASAFLKKNLNEKYFYWENCSGNLIEKFKVLNASGNLDIITCAATHGYLPILRENPDAILPTMGGQTALNLAVKLSESDFLKQNNIELIGADLRAINKAEDRKLFKESMEKINVNVCPSGIASNLDEAINVSKEISSYPLIIRPAFTLGGVGGGIAFNLEEFVELSKSGLEESPSNQILIEKSLIGWKEFELEVMRDTADNVVIVCSIENLDPMGVHTGDSITVAPAQTLTDKEYQRLRDLSLKIIREVGVETGGSNIQFALNSSNGEVIVIEMYPRVSRSSALASKATGFPIAKIAALLSVGYTLDEIINDITKKTPACFEPSIDYVVTKIPRFAFEKFKGSSNTLSTAMKSVGESMAIGRSFEESFQKALRSLEVGIFGWECDSLGEFKNENDLKNSLRNPTSERILIVKKAMEL